MTVEEWLGQNNKLGQDIWHKKYQFNNESFDEWLTRVSGGNRVVQQMIANKQFLFGGRILANRGLNKKGIRCCYSNCFVVSPPEDNLESIFDTAKNMARTYSYGGGVGVDISKLAPKGAKVHNTAKESSGAVSFMDLYSLVTGLIGQSGRRGALMISISCEHPDIEDFITIKSDINRVTKANISVRMTDKFMEAVEHNDEFTLHFERPETGEHIEKVVKAKDLFMLIAKMNWDMGEPGVLFWDRIKSWNLLSNNTDFEFAGTNPCAEEPLPAGGSCLLGSINLDAFVDRAAKEFDFDSFCNCVKNSVYTLNQVLDEGLPFLPLEEQRKSVKDWRQIGLGIMGLADMLIHLGIKYGSPASVLLCDQIGKTMIQTACAASNDLNGSECYPRSNNAEDLTPFGLDNGINAPSLYNSQLLTIAPTGTLSTMLEISGGIEPIYANSYTRKTESLFEKDKEYKVYTPIVQEYMATHHITDESELPDYFITAQTLDYHDRIAMQAVWQTHIDASISSTVNVPNSFTVEQIADLYMEAWKHGLKGITIFRDGCNRAGILSNLPKKEEAKIERAEELPRGYIESVPEGISYRKYKLTTGCGKLYLFVGVDETTNKIYDFFTNTDGVGGCTINTQANSRLMSACIRGGVPVEYVIEQLQKSGTCPSFQYQRGKGKPLSQGKSCPSAIAYVLQNILNELRQDGNETAEDKPESKAPDSGSVTLSEVSRKGVCPECGSGEIAFEGGCVTCKACGYSKCG